MVFGDGLRERGVAAHLGIFDAVVKFQRAVELFFLRVKFRELAQQA